jgi:MFS family permease
MAEPEPGGTTPEPQAHSGQVLTGLIVSQMGMHSAMAGLRMAGSLQILQEGYSAWAVGLLLALFAAAPVLTALPAGRLADRHGYHRPVYLAVALSVLGLALAVCSTQVQGHLHFGLLCLAAMAAGAGTNIGMLTIQRTAGSAARDSTERMRIFSWLGVAPPFSNVIGAVSAGFMIDGFGFAAAYLMLLLMPVATLLTARQVPRLPGRPSIAAPSTQTAWDLFSLPGFKRLLTVNWLLSMCWDVHMFALPVLGFERGFSASTIGLISGTFTASVTLVRMLIPALAHRLDERRVLQVAMAGTGLVFVLYPLAPNPWLMAACAAMLGVTLGSVQPMVMSMLHHVTPQHRHGEALALRSMAINMTSTALPLVFGATGAVLGAAVLFWTVGAAVGVGSALVRRLPKVS